MTTPPRDDIARFFTAVERAGNELDTDWLASAFSEQFLNLSPDGAGVVSTQTLLESLPMRARLFASIGADGSTLTALAETPLDDLHTLAETRWQLRFPESPETAPLTLRSTFVLRHEAGVWQIVLYLNHDNIVSIIKDRAEARA